ncbi:MAG: sigma factor-like helix-turn-helix DNA-binding protein, partial [Pseudomonadota bacterium]
LVDDAPNAEVILEEEQMRLTIARCFENLSTPQRVAVVLTYFEELPNKDAAERMGLQLKAFESTLGRARRTLASMLETEYASGALGERSVG